MEGMWKDGRMEGWKEGKWKDGRMEKWRCSWNGDKRKGMERRKEMETKEVEIFLECRMEEWNE
jgi:hypothetical protein